MNANPMPDTAPRPPRPRGPAGWGLAAVLCLGAPGGLHAEPGAPAGASPVSVPVPVPAAVPAADAAGPVQAPLPAATPEAPGRQQALSHPQPPEPPAAPATGGERGRDSLDPDLVYAVLVAETAARRGDLAMAYSHYLHAAHLARDPTMAELAVRAAANAGDDAGAMRAADFWLELAPDSPGANQVAALMQIKAGDREAALTRLARVVALASDPESGYLQAAGIIGRALGPAERVPLMQALAERNPSSPEAWQALAVMAASVEQFEAATAAAARAQELRPDWDQPRVFLVKLLLAQGQRDEARARLRQSLAERPDDAALRQLFAQLLVEDKDYTGAREAFVSLLAAHPKDPEALFAAGVLSLELGDLPAARDYLTRLYQSGERRDEAAFYLGQVAERADDPAAAIDWYGKTQGSNLLEARVRTAVLRAKAGEVERARELLQQLRDQVPEEAQALFQAEAEILDQAGRQEAALKVYDKALAAFPDDADLLYGRAMYAIKLERLADAERDLRRIIAADPDHADALNALGYTLADRTDRYDEALGYIEHAYRLKPTEPAILDSMGWVNHRLGRDEVALAYLRQANDAMKDGEIAAHLGAVLWALGRQDEARAVWQAALRDHPGHAYLLATIARHPGAGIDTGAAPGAEGAPPAVPPAAADPAAVPGASPTDPSPAAAGSEHQP